jgi:hypothetical protein
MTGDMCLGKLETLESERLQPFGSEPKLVDALGSFQQGELRRKMAEYDGSEHVGSVQNRTRKNRERELGIQAGHGAGTGEDAHQTVVSRGKILEFFVDTQVVTKQVLA